MKLEVEDNCPLNNFKKCKQFKCAWFVQMKGTNPNDGKEVDEYACSMAWLPMLLVENAMQARQTGGAIESFRNEMVKANASNQNLLELSKFMELKNNKVISQ
jgi:hypothetical protein